MANDKIPTSRVGRRRRSGGWPPGRRSGRRAPAPPTWPAATRASKAALERRQIEAAEQIVAALGTMKGAAMKVGQVMSFLDVGLVPEEYREEFQRKLAALRDAAPTVTFKDMRKVIEEELDDRLEDVFEEFDEEPIAAASIGQVYRATTARRPRGRGQGPVPGGRRRGPRRHAEPRPDPAAGQADRARPRPEGDRRGDPLAGSTRSSTTSSRPRTSARWRGSSAATRSSSIPDVVTSLSRERVMVSEFVARDRLRGAQELRARRSATAIGEIIFRFYFGCLYRHHQFSGDPHPGNSMLLDDGRMAFLDFGLFKRMPAGAGRARDRGRPRDHRGRHRHDHAARDRGRVLPRARQVQPGPRARPLPRGDLVVHAATARSS